MMPTRWVISEPYRPRPITFHDIREMRGWRLKLYSIVYGRETINWRVYDDLWPTLASTLPELTIGDGRPGVGFLIAHTGRSVHYGILASWDNENELPLRLFVRSFRDGQGWRPATSTESVCVWDLQVIAYERDAYVEHILEKSADPDLRGYLHSRLQVQV